MYFKHINHEIDDWVRRQNSYEQRIKYRKSRTFLGPTMGWGFVETISGPLKLEGAVNLGLAWNYVQWHGFPDDAEELDPPNLSINYDPGHYLFPLFGVSLKLKMGFK